MRVLQATEKRPPGPCVGTGMGGTHFASCWGRDGGARDIVEGLGLDWSVWDVRCSLGS